MIQTVIIFICVYMPNDININIYEYNEVLSAIHMLQSLYTPHYIICDGDWNTDFTTKTSLLTKSLVSFCDREGLTCVNLVRNAQQFTYVRDMNGSKSLIDQAPYQTAHRNKAGCKEHVRKECDHALHWHRLYLQHGQPQSGYIFEMRKLTRRWLLLFAFRDVWKDWGDSNFQIFSQNCQFHHRRLESLEHL